MMPVGSPGMTADRRHCARAKKRSARQQEGAQHHQRQQLSAECHPVVHKPGNAVHRCRRNRRIWVWSGTCGRTARIPKVRGERRSPAVERQPLNLKFLRRRNAQIHHEQASSKHRILHLRQAVACDRRAASRNQGPRRPATTGQMTGGGRHLSVRLPATRTASPSRRIWLAAIETTVVAAAAAGQVSAAARVQASWSGPFQ